MYVNLKKMNLTYNKEKTINTVISCLKKVEKVRCFLRPKHHQIGLNKLFQIPVHNPLCVSAFNTCPYVLY